MQYNTLLTRIAADIYSNGAELITGDLLQNVLNDMVGALASAGACYKGTITPASAAPLDLDQPTVYLALTAGTYTNFVDSNNDPIVTTGPALITYDGGPSLVFTKTDLPSGSPDAVLYTPQTLNDLQKARARSNIGAAGTADLRPITLQGMIGESLFLLLPDNGDPLPLRIDISAHTTGDDANYPKVGSLLITIAMGGSAEVEAYYYGTDISDLLGGVAVYEDDENYYLVVRPANTLTEPRYFSVTPLNGGDIEAQMLEIDEQTLVDTITPTELEDTSNKVTSIGSSSTDSEYPSAKCMYDLIGDIETLINAL